MASWAQATEDGSKPAPIKMSATAPWSRASEGIVRPAGSRSHKSGTREISSNADDSSIANVTSHSPFSEEE